MTGPMPGCDILDGSVGTGTGRGGGGWEGCARGGERGNNDDDTSAETSAARMAWDRGRGCCQLLI
jgi:hypothetical protein